MAQGDMTYAIIYCRVSDIKQTTRGDGLSSQETRCREYASHKGLAVSEVFRDHMSGEFADRPGINAMIAYLKKHKAQDIVVIIEDITRIARDIVVHRQLREAILRAGATLVSPSMVFSDDDPDAQFAEGIGALQSEHHRKKNAIQTLNRMKARSANGFWCFQAPWGYRYAPASGGGKIMVRDEPLASIITEAFESYASGRLESIGEVKRFLEAHPEFPTSKWGLVLHERVRQILTQPIYAGYIEVPRWKIARRKGQHEGFISLETFNRVQERLLGKPRAPARIDLNVDFPMRGFVCCDDCGHPLTANWSKGELKSYPYYLCRQQLCESRGKSIARDKVETAFDELLRSLTPARELFDLASAVFRDLWHGQVQKSTERKAELKKLLGEQDRLLNQLLDRIRSTPSTRQARRSLIS